MATADDFRRIFTDTLLLNVQAEPSRYAYTDAEVPRVAAKMLNALATGDALVGQAAKEAARACGIRPTAKAIRLLLSGGP